MSSLQLLHGIVLLAENSQKKKKKKNTFIQLYSVPKTNKPKITTLVIIFYIFVLVFVFCTTTR